MQTDRQEKPMRRIRHLHKAALSMAANALHVGSGQMQSHDVCSPVNEKGRCLWLALTTHDIAFLQGMSCPIVQSEDVARC